MVGFWRSPLDPLRVVSAPVTHWQDNERGQREDSLVVEEPLEIRLNDEPLAVIMRTPGNDHELVAGFLFSEGIARDLDAALSLEEAIDEDGMPQPNVINARLPSVASEGVARPFTVSASCGLCGTQRISDVLCRVPPLSIEAGCIAAATIYTLADQLRAQQRVFTHTGGLHAAGLFTLAGELCLSREDVGRHNAVDKLVGHGLLAGALPYDRHVLLVSGRTSFEIIQKALLARIICIVAISAPSSLAVELANEGGMTLVGFLRDRSMNVYTHPERIV